MLGIEGEGTPQEKFWRNNLLIALFVMFSFWTIIRISHTHWLLPSGITFFMLWWLPYRYWPVVLLSAMTARLNAQVFAYYFLGIPGKFGINWFNMYGWRNHPDLTFLGSIVDPLAQSTGALFLKYRRIKPVDLQSEKNMLMLHIAAIISAAVAGTKDRIYVFLEQADPDVSTFYLRVFLGHFVGIMLAAPLLAIAVTPKFRKGMLPILKASSWLLPLFGGLVFLGINSGSLLMLELMRLAMLTSVIVFAMRYGWRGATISVFMTSVAVQLVDRYGMKGDANILLQAFIAVAGAMALLFGMAQDILTEKNEALTASNHRATELANELREAALKMQVIEANERRQLALELHDEFGQSLTALQTHLQLAKARPDEAVPVDLLSSLTFAMRNNISRVLEALRPAALDEVGLIVAIDRGSLRRMVENAEISYSMTLEGDASLLSQFDIAYQNSAYRIVQEALTNIVKHSRADACEVRLRISERNDELMMFINVLDDGIGRVDDLSRGHGLQSLRDRVRSLGGVLHAHDLGRGLRLHALLRKPR